MKSGILWCLLICFAFGAFKLHAADEPEISNNPNTPASAIKGGQLNPPTPDSGETTAKQSKQVEWTDQIVPLLVGVVLGFILAVAVLAGAKWIRNRNSVLETSIVPKSGDPLFNVKQEAPKPTDALFTVKQLEQIQKLLKDSLPVFDNSSSKAATTNIDTLIATTENNLKDHMLEKIEKPLNQITKLIVKTINDIKTISGESLKESSDKVNAAVNQLQQFHSETEESCNRWVAKANEVALKVSQLEKEREQQLKSEQALQLEREQFNSNMLRLTDAQRQLELQKADLERNKSELAASEAKALQRKAEHEKFQETIAARQAELERQQQELQRQREERWPVSFRDGAPLAAMRGDLEAADGSSSTAQLLLQSVSRFQTLLNHPGTNGKPLPTEDRLDEALRYMGNQLYLYGQERGLSAEQMQALAERWAGALNPLLNEKNKISVVEIGTLFKPNVHAGNLTSGQTVSSAQGWIVLGSTGNVMHRALVQ